MTELGGATHIDVLLEGVRLLLSHTRGGEQPGRVLIENIEGSIHLELERLSTEGRLEEFSLALLNVCIYPTSGEEVPAYKRLRNLFSNRTRVLYQDHSLLFRYRIDPDDIIL